MVKMKQKQKKNTGVMAAVLKSFIPYTKENLMLSYSPNKFFNHLEYLDRIAEETGASKETIRVTISRAKRAGLLRTDKNNRVQTTWSGKIRAKIIPTKKLKHSLVIIFDIPEQHKRSRDRLRDYLKTNYCKMTQKSVWVTKYDIYDELLEVINDLKIDDYVTVFMADEIH